MHIRAGVLLLVALALSTAEASTDTFYKYRDKRTGRDVFVNSLSQVPKRYRDQAKLMLEGPASHAAGTAEPPIEITESSAKPTRDKAQVTISAGSTGSDLRQAISGKSLLKDGPAVASALLDAKLVRAGSAPLTWPERASFGRLLLAILIASIVAGLAALAVWIVIIVIAVRDQRRWWALLIFLFSPLAYVYLFLHVGKGRALFKTLCTVGMLSPALVGLVAAWRFYAWFHAIVQARGGRL